MSKEYELKVLDINVDEWDKQFLLLGARKKEEFFKILVYVLDDGGPVDEFVRLRSSGEKTTLCYKFKDSHKHDGTEEIECEVSDFENLKFILSKLSSSITPHYQEKKRIIYTFEDFECCIDFWPKIQPFIEIEAKDSETLRKAVEKLNLDFSVLSNPSLVALYKREGLDMFSYKELKFEKNE